MTQYDFVREPRGEILDQLIAAAVEACDRFTVERSAMVFDERATRVFEKFHRR